MEKESQMAKAIAIVLVVLAVGSFTVVGCTKPAAKPGVGNNGNTVVKPVGNATVPAAPVVNVANTK
jgi:hypothetical protein